jgi:hypothetical protein
LLIAAGVALLGTLATTSLALDQPLFILAGPVSVLLIVAGIRRWTGS